MTKHLLFRLAALVCVSVAGARQATADEPAPLRIGIIGCDTSHVPAFTKRHQWTTGEA